MTNMNRVFCFMIIGLWICLQAAISAETSYIFQQINPQNGLSYQVNSIAVTYHNGYAWMGTNTGIGGFNGYELKRYLNARVIQLFKDEQCTVWAATTDGLYRYDELGDQFLRILDVVGETIHPLSICQGKDGIYFGASGKIYKYSYDRKEVKTVLPEIQGPYYQITHLEVWDEHRLFVSNRRGRSMLVDLRSGETEQVPFPCHQLVAMLVDKAGHFWISSYGKGVKCYDREGKLLHHYTTQNLELASDVVMALTEYRGKIWMGTDGNGISVVDPKTHEMLHLKHVPGNPNSLPSNSILCLYADEKNGIWAGSVRSGLFNIKEVGINFYTDALPNTHYGLSMKSVLSLCQEPGSEDIWIGTDGGGLNRFDPKTGSFYHQASTWGSKVVSIIGTDSDHLLLSLFGKGIYRYHKQTGQYSPLMIVDEVVNDALCHRGKSVNMLRHAPDAVLLLAEQPYCYYWKQNRFQKIELPSPNQNILGELKPIALRKSTAYFHDSKRIYSLECGNQIMKITLAFRGDTVVNSASIDEHGYLWIGCNRGLCRYSLEKKKKEYIPTNLASNLSSVICDQRGRVWIGSNEQLFSRLIDQEQFVLYDSSDGVAPNEYLPKPRLLSSQGDIYLGTVNGLLRIKPELPKEKIVPPVLDLVNVTVGGQRLQGWSDERNVLEIKEQSSPITLSIVARNKDIFRKPAYRYRVHGLGHEAIYSYLPTLTLTGLHPGEYQITASCSTRLGGWTEEYPILKLVVLLPWYRTTWFIALCFLLVILFFIVINFYYLRRKEDRLRWTMKEHEQQVYEEKVRFLININHELRTPLTLIHAPLKQLLEKISPENEQHRLLQGIVNQSTRMKKLLDMVLDVRKMEVKESVLHLENVQLEPWLNRMVEDFRPEAEMKHLHLVIRFEDVLPMVCCDEEKCTTVVTNLLVNALKYSNEGGEIVLTVQMTQDGKRVRISISDQGVGLKNVDVNQLFTRFYQGNNSRPGTGIGLSYAKILVEQHGGSIGAYDHAEGPGATFWFELPLHLQPSEVAVQPQAYLNDLLASVENVENVPNEVIYHDETHEKTLLVVDDNQEMVAYLSSALQPYFKEVLVAYDGVEALEQCKQAHPDVVVSDIQMPEMNGYELCKRIKEDFEISHIPVVLLTARTDEESKTFGYKNGADNYLTKPFEISTLYTAVYSLLQNRERMKSGYTKVGVTPALTPQESTFSPVDEKFLQKLNEVVMENLSSPELGVPFLCAELGISRASLYNKLKALTGMGANNYIGRMRIEQAVTLLSTTDMNINEISDAVGFSTSRYFNKVFKEMMGCSPTQYKEQLYNKKDNRL